MSKETPAASQAAAAPRGAVDLRDRVPGMADDALATLKVNAQRMKETGNAQQRGMAEDLLPVVEAELARRRAEKAASAPTKARGGKKKKAAEPEAEAEAEAEAE